MKNTNDDFEQYLEELTQDIIDAFTVKPDRNPYHVLGKIHHTPLSKSPVTHTHGD